MRAIYLIIFAIFCTVCASVINYADDGSTDAIKHTFFSIGLIAAAVSFVLMLVGV